MRPAGRDVRGQGRNDPSARHSGCETWCGSLHTAVDISFGRARVSYSAGAAGRLRPSAAGEYGCADDCPGCQTERFVALLRDHGHDWIRDRRILNVPPGSTRREGNGGAQSIQTDAQESLRDLRTLGIRRDRRSRDTARHPFRCFHSCWRPERCNIRNTNSRRRSPWGEWRDIRSWHFWRRAMAAAILKYLSADGHLMIVTVVLLLLVATGVTFFLFARKRRKAWPRRVASRKNGASALMAAMRKASWRVIRLPVSTPHAPCASRICRGCRRTRRWLPESSTPSSTTRFSRAARGARWLRIVRTIPCRMNPRAQTQLSRNAQRVPRSWTTSMPPSSPTKYFQEFGSSPGRGPDAGDFLGALAGAGHHFLTRERRVADAAGNVNTDHVEPNVRLEPRGNRAHGFTDGFDFRPGAGCPRRRRSFPFGSSNTAADGAMRSSSNQKVTRQKYGAG